MSTDNNTPSSTVVAQIGRFLEDPTHALLLTGTGCTQKAIELATKLLNVSSLENKPQYREVTPEKNSISIEQIRELIGFFRLKVPGMAKIKRVAVIQDAGTMGTEAQNALLKLLEEPPVDSVLILTSTHPQNLLTTIRSRVQTIHLPETRQTPDTETIQLAKQVLAGTTYDRLLLVDGLSKQKDVALTLVTTLTTVAMASLEAAARKQSTSVDRWKVVLQAAHTAEDALLRSGNAKLVLTELMLAM